MGKIVKHLFFCMLFTITLSGCRNVGKDDVSNFKDTDIFKTVSKDFGGHENYTIVYHKETKVMYVIVTSYASDGRGAGITPLLNSDGTPMLYSGESE